MTRFLLGLMMGLFAGGGVLILLMTPYVFPGLLMLFVALILLIIGDV